MQAPAAKNQKKEKSNGLDCGICVPDGIVRIACTPMRGCDLNWKECVHCVPLVLGTSLGSDVKCVMRCTLNSLRTNGQIWFPFYVRNDSERWKCACSPNDCVKCYLHLKPEKKMATIFLFACISAGNVPSSVAYILPIHAYTDEAQSRNCSVQLFREIIISDENNNFFFELENVHCQRKSELEN